MRGGKKIIATRQLTSEQARQVLERNVHSGYTMPSSVLYPHQWLWDSCFHAIGLRHDQPERALEELAQLLRGQWPNGMIPHMIFSDARHGHNKYNVWKSHVCDNCVIGLKTSAITQPPVVAWAFEQVIQKMRKPQRQAALEKYLPQIIRYHEWLYRERDPEATGRVVIIHPWESGLDNNPALMATLHRHIGFNWAEEMLLRNTLFRNLYHRLREDLRRTGPTERTTTIENWTFGRLVARYRQKFYDIDSILLDPRSFVVEDIAFNSILVRSNTSLQTLAQQANITLSPELKHSMSKTSAALPDFWEEKLGMYASRDWRTGQRIPIPTVAGLLPLITNSIPKTNAKQLVKQLNSKDFATPWPVPTYAATRKDYDPMRYWQGPTWINMNWMLVQGLRDYGFKKPAQNLTDHTLKLVETFGIWEYYNSQTGAGHGINDFSWTAALYLDLLKTRKK